MRRLGIVSACARGDTHSSRSPLHTLLGMLATVFRVHRFVAGGFGLCLLLLPTEFNAAMSPGRVLPVEEKLTLQSWAAFMLAVAYLPTPRPRFPYLRRRPSPAASRFAS